MTPCEELGYKVGDRFEVLTGSEAFTAESIVELFRDDGSPAPLFKLVSGECDFKNCNREKGAYESLDSVRPMKKEANNMTIKTNDKVKFSDAAKGLKSYDADAVGVVTHEYWENSARDGDMFQVTFTYPCGRKQHINNICARNLELMEEEQITLQPGDWCGNELTEEQYSEVFDCFVNAGASVYEDKDYDEFKGYKNIVWTDGDSDTLHSADPDTSPFCLRQLTYSQITNATNAKPKEDAVKEPEVIETKPAQKLLDAALCELSMLNEQIAALTKQRNEVQEYIKQRNAAHGVSVEFGVEVEEKKELNITNWRDLLPGDVIQFLSVHNDDCDGNITAAREYAVSKIDLVDIDQPIRVTNDKGRDWYPEKETQATWRFISRPS